jgi:trigger factor
MSQFNLKIKQKDREDGRIQLDVTVPAAQTGNLLKNAAYTLARQNSIAPGASEEETIAKLIETVGEPQYQAFANHFVMTGMAFFAVSEKGIEIILDPEVSTSDQVAEGKDFRFVALLTRKPEYQLSSYDPVSVRIPSVSVSEEEIDQQLYMIAENNADHIEDKDGVVKEGSEIVFGIATSESDGTPIPNLTAERRVYKLGENFMPPDFDSNLLGMKVGDVKTFSFGLPDPMALPPDAPEGTEYPMVQVSTTITLHQVTKKVIPAITDAWVEAKMPEAGNVAGLREMIRQNGLEYKGRELEQMKYNLAASELASRMQGSIPDELYEFTRSDIIANYQAQLAQNNMDIQQFLKQQGMDEQQFSMQIMLQTRETLRQGFSLDALARHLKLSIAEEDIADALTRMAPGHENEARAQFEGSGRMFQLREAALRNKANKWLVDNATFEVLA